MILNARNRGLFFWTPCLLVLLSASPVLAYNEEEAKKVSEDMKEFGFKDVTTKEGLVFRIPSDMPIENRGGLVGPVPFDEYLYLKFKKLEEKLIQVDKKIDRLDETLGAVKKRLDDQAADAAAPAAPGPTSLNS